MKSAFLFLAVVLTACTGGVGDTVSTSTPPPLVQEDPDQGLVVVSLDINGDDDPDLLTVEPDGTIVAALESTSGDPIDTTDLRKGQKIDAKVAEAIAAYVSNTVELASETRLDVVDSTGATVSVTVFE